MAQQAKTLGGVKVRYDWYQTETHVVLNVLHKNIDATKLKIDCQPRLVTIGLPDITEDLIINLSHEVHATDVRKKVTPSMLEVKLAKVDGTHWQKLEGEDALVGKPIPKAESSSTGTTAKAAKNWDAVVKAEGEDEGDALNELFKKIYSDGSDEVRKAMNKSFMESGGTVLSTNWKEVKTDKVDMKPPEGLEWKKWD